jgi:hypothetical protein
MSCRLRRHVAGCCTVTARRPSASEATEYLDKPS